jgi:hypothetical protein
VLYHPGTRALADLEDRPEIGGVVAPTIAAMVRPLHMIISLSVVRPTSGLRGVCRSRPAPAHYRPPARRLAIRATHVLRPPAPMLSDVDPAYVAGAPQRLG